MKTEIKKAIVTGALAVSLVFRLTGEINYACNTGSVKTSTHHTISGVTGVYNYVDFTKYKWRVL